MSEKLGVDDFFLDSFSEKEVSLIEARLEV
jgi:hypothetical protein